MEKQDLRYRLKKVCANSHISRKAFVNKYWNLEIIKGVSAETAYRYVSNMLSPAGSPIQQWLITAIEMEEAENANS